MNREDAHLYLPYVQAMTEGKIIQGQDDHDSSVWYDLKNPAFDHYPPSKFRVKPEPREWFLEPSKIPIDGFYVRATEGPGFIRVREILD